MAFGNLTHCFMQHPSYFLQCTPPSSIFIEFLISFYSFLPQVFKRLLGPRSFDSPEGFLAHKHYYILCLFAKGQTKNLKGLRSKNKKFEGFAKQKQSTIFTMRHASQLVVHHPSLIYNVPLIIAALLRHIQQKKLYDPFSLCPP